MVVKDYDLCAICEHTPAFCYCNGSGMSREEYHRRQQEIIRESVLNDDELRWHVIQEMLKMMGDEHYEDE